MAKHHLHQRSGLRNSRSKMKAVSPLRLPNHYTAKNFAAAEKWIKVLTEKLSIRAWLPDEDFGFYRDKKVGHFGSRPWQSRFQLRFTDDKVAPHPFTFSLIWWVRCRMFEAHLAFSLSALPQNPLQSNMFPMWRGPCQYPICQAIDRTTLVLRRPQTSTAGCTRSAVSSARCSCPEPSSWTSRPRPARCPHCVRLGGRAAVLHDWRSELRASQGRRFPTKTRGHCGAAAGSTRVCGVRVYGGGL
ncbi:hypothetical protein DFJ73DRAFT_964028 [Zopfochytrium polystomum]|nr:hypothetical protein DFJ73DRAFT_964028 [Zopfochytrium polystomum]